MSIQLSETQIALLGAASQRDDRLLGLPKGPKLAAARKAAAKLTEAGLVKEVKAKRDAPVWRRDDETGYDYALKLTAAGLKAITAPSAAVDKQVVQSPPSVVPLPATNAANIAPNQAANKAPRLNDSTITVSNSAFPRAGTKIAAVIGLLSRTQGATIDELVTAMGWLPHTTRAALTGLRKRGYVLFSDPSDRTRGSTYRIEAVVAPAPSHSSGQEATGASSAEEAKTGANETTVSRKRRRLTAVVTDSAQTREAP